ncbi:hypothetical protein NBRC10512_001021 [Rhodotorula toruloides]|uniref:RHTO0S06e09582g1_1 n=2 Tax=Rhodotorula toruloides TaxID=5286 RepID=A0A061B363_RHOTO|nr:bZIP transcription factor [Rhodotorula toruloides NP11]EMS19456.1 bZIP transcription factor [Rhodotorula toruloides NP11]CDR42082.1 RHTO0S06e09582g1_1 [Rhodotorula toruloides]
MSTTLADLSGLQGMLAQLSGNNAAADPLVVQPGDTDTQGMSFAELFSHYLAPEVAKLPPSSSSAPTTDLASPFVFGGVSSAPSTSTAGSTSGDAFSPLSASTSFDPSTFMPTIPGSPFSHSSDGNSGHSPFSLADLDFSSTTVGGGAGDGFAIDPSVFGPPAETNAFDPVLALPTAAALPPLPALPIAPMEPVEQPQPQPQQLTALGRPKRNVAHTVIEEEDEDELYSSDGSVATTSGSRKGRRTSRKPSAAKKARSSLASSEEPPSSRKQAARSVAQLASATLHKTSANSHLPPVPQWADKPDPEEYSKLSSKEKRQLRNKLSARNFRHRRKEYITTLEEQIHDRDTIIATLRDEVGVMRAENSGLKTEVATLKEKWQDLLDKLSSLSAPPSTAAAGLGTNPSRAVASAATGAAVVKQEEDVESSIPAAGLSTRRIGTRAAVSSTNALQLPNLSKDVSAHARRSTGAWSTASPGLGGGFMSVHTTLIPDVAPLADGVAPKLPSSGAASPFSNQSFNPALNALSQNQLADLPALTSHLRTGFSAAQQQQQQQAKPAQQTPKGTFEDFFASNPFWLRPDQLEQNRAALYGKLANNAAGLVAAQKEQQQQPQQQDDAFLPVPQGFKPAFFRSPKLSPSTSATTSELLAYQSPAAFSSPPPLSHQDAIALREQAMSASVAHLASQTLMQKMMASFWDAFSGSPASSGLSADKVKAVLGGKARVEVVPVSAPTSPKTAPASIDALGAQMGGLRLGASTSEEAASSSSCSFTQQVLGRRWVMNEKRA